MATDSWRHREDTTHLRNRLPVVQSISEDAQAKDSHPPDRFLTCLAVGQHPRKVGHFRKPAAIFFLLDFNGQWHDSSSLRLAFRLGGVPRKGKRGRGKGGDSIPLVATRFRL